MLVFLSRHRLLGTTCVVVIAMTLLFCSWRIYTTSVWLEEFRVEIRESHRAILELQRSALEAIRRR